MSYRLRYLQVKRKKLKSGSITVYDPTAPYWTYDGNQNFGYYFTPNATYLYRRVQWQDLLKDVQKVGKELLNLLITMKDLLLIRSRSFFENSTSTSTSSTSGCTVKLHPSLYDTTTTTGPLPSQGSTNTTFSGGSLTKRKGHRSSGIRPFSECVCHSPWKLGWVHGKKRCRAR